MAAAVLLVPRSSSSRRRAAAAALLPLLIAATAALAAAGGIPATALPRRVAKAPVDECYYQVGLSVLQNPPCPRASRPKVNGAYIFGMTKPSASSDVWMGTGENNQCLITGSTAMLKEDSLPPSLGDWRPPRVFALAPATGELVDLSPVGDPLLNATIGMRSAGSLCDVVFLGGPNLQASFIGSSGGIVLFAYQASTRRYLGSKLFMQYRNIRSWAAWDGETPGSGSTAGCSGGALFFGALSASGRPGRVVKWTGSLQNPFQFEEVGILTEEAAYLTIHEGRVFASTWPDQSYTQFGGIWMSPLLKASRAGLSRADSEAFTKVFSWTWYEPDRLVASTYYGGPMRSFGDYLYFGSINFPFSGALAHTANRQGPFDQRGGPMNAQADRGVVVVRARGLGGSAPKFELLYGEDSLPAFTGSGGWREAPTGLGKPLYGPSGFGNRRNAYIWSAEVFNNELYFGTFDTTTSTQVVAAGGSASPMLIGGEAGADLFKFKNTSSPAVAVTRTGFGNPGNFGFRNLVVAEGRLYAGTANPHNLWADASARISGGWEVWQVAGEGQTQAAITSV